MPLRDLPGFNRLPYGIRYSVLLLYLIPAVPICNCCDNFVISGVLLCKFWFFDPWRGSLNPHRLDRIAERLHFGRVKLNANACPVLDVVRSSNLTDRLRVGDVADQRLLVLLEMHDKAVVFFSGTTDYLLLSGPVDRQYLALSGLKSIGPDVVGVMEFFPMCLSLTHFRILVFLSICEAEWLRRYISSPLERRSYTASSSLLR